jgi:hypothetical protein
MAFPQSPLGTKVQLQIGGVWTDATRYDTQTKVLQDRGVTINRGRGNVQDRTPAGTATWTWQDPNGIYVNDNPRSPYYGVLPRNTPVRVFVPRATPALLIVDVNDGARSSTPNNAAYNIVGDIDIRIEFEPARFRRWASNSGRFQILCSKYSGAGNRAWWVRMRDDGIVNFSWSFDGTTSITHLSTAPLPTTGRIALRVQLDVDNGAAGATTTFATASTIGGTYSTLGTPVTRAGITTVFANTQPIELGTANGGTLDGVFSSLSDNFIGRIYGFQLRDSAATLVTSPDFTAQTTGTTSFADAQGRTWTNAGVAEITNADYRFYGELSAPKQRPEVSSDGVGKAVYIDAEAGGIIRRLTANATPLQSPIYRNFNTYTPSGWWPGEDDSGALLASSAVTGADPAQITDITFSGYDSGLAGSAGVMTMGGTGPIFVGIAKAGVASTEAHFYGYFKFPSVPLSAQTLFTVYGDGAVKRWEWVVDATNYTTKGYDASGTQTVTKSTTFGVGAEPNNWIGYHLQVTQNGANVDIKSEWHSVSTATFYNQNAIGTLSVAGTVGRFTKVLVQGIAALSGVKMAHLLLTTNNTNRLFNSAVYAAYSKGYAGETADARFIRVCTEQGVQPVMIGALGDSEAMGAQPIDEVMNVLYQCAEVDGGQLTESRDQLALQYRTRTSLTNQYGLALSYTVGKHLSAALASTPDDLNIKNDITLNRVNGSFARAVLESGPMSVLPPSQGGIGRVPDSPDINNYLDSRLPALAQYALGKGTWPEARYPSVKISLHRSPFIASSTLYLLAGNTDIGDYFSISDMPQFMPPDAVNLMTEGYTEELHTFTWDITYNTSPYGYWRANEFSTVAGEELRADSFLDSTGTTQTQLAAAITSTATSLSIKTLSGALLSIDPLDYPADVLIGGERMTFTAVTGSTSPQTATATRSVNGIVKAQTINTGLRVFQSFYTTL